MRRLAIAFLVAALGTTGAQNSPKSAADSTSRLLLRYEDGWAAALVKRDAEYFRRMLAPGFVYTEDAKLMSRADVLRDAITPGDTVTAARNEDMVVHIAGPVTAVVTGFLIVDGRAGGKKYSHHYRFTDTWVKGADGRWQIAAAQDYLIPK